MARSNRGKVGRKKAKIPTEPIVEKKPVVVSNPPPKFRDGHIAWRFSGVDLDGPFSWLRLEDPAEFKEVIDRLSAFEPMNEEQLSEQGCHFITLDKLSKDAQDRLAKIKLDDLDELYSLRITGRKRVFGIHRGHYMRVLWWDPQHNACPVAKR